MLSIGLFRFVATSSVVRRGKVLISEADCEYQCTILFSVPWEISVKVWVIRGGAMRIATVFSAPNIVYII